MPVQFHPPRGFQFDGVRMPAYVISLSEDECSYDPSLGAYVHRFDTARYVCRCGEEDLREKIKEQEEAKARRGSPWFKHKKNEA